MPKDSGNSGWKVNGTGLFVSFQWKTSGSNGKSEFPLETIPMEIRVPFTSFTSSRLFAAISLILARKIAREWSLGWQLGNEWNLCQMEHFFNPMEISNEISGIFPVNGKRLGSNIKMFALDQKGCG